MAAVANDIKAWRYGTGDHDTLTSYPVQATAQLYVGCVALISAASVTGALKNAATPAATDIPAGIVDGYAGGTGVATGPGVLGGATDGAVWANVKTGSFFMIGSGSGITGATALTEANNGKAVYYAGETAAGPVASASSNSSAFPLLGLQLPQDPGIAGMVTPGTNMWPIKMNVVGGP